MFVVHARPIDVFSVYLPLQDLGELALRKGTELGEQRRSR